MKLVKVRPTDKSVNEFRFDDALIGMIAIGYRHKTTYHSFEYITSTWCELYKEHLNKIRKT